MNHPSGSTLTAPARIYVLLIALACALVVAPATAHADSCEQIREQIRDVQRQINDVNQRNGGTRDQAREQIDENLLERQSATADLAGAFNELAALAASAPSAERAALNARILAAQGRIGRLANRLGPLLDAWRIRNSSTLALQVRLLELNLQLASSNCNEPPGGCSQGSAAPVQIPLPPARGTTERLRDGYEQLVALAAASSSASPTVGRVRPDGTVVDPISGEFVRNPLNPRGTLQVPVGATAPFHPGQLIVIESASAANPTGGPIGVLHITDQYGHAVVAGNTSGSQGGDPATGLSGWLSSFWVTVPGAEGSGTTSRVVPILTSAGVVGALVLEWAGRRVLLPVQLMLMVLESERRRDEARRGDRGCGFHASVSLGDGYTAIGTSCDGRFSRWNWRVFQGDLVGAVGRQQGKGLSIRYSESLTRDQRWGQVRDASVFLHMFTSSEIGSMDVAAKQLWRSSMPTTKDALKHKVEGWRAKFVPGGSRGLGFVLWSKPSISSRMLVSRGAIQRGCSALAPPGYQERDASF